MKRIVGMLAGSFLMAGIGFASAQDVLIAPDQQIVIREYVIAHPVEPVAPIDGIAIGQVVPPEVVLYPIEGPDMTYGYVVMDNQTLIVDPGTRQIIQIIE